MAIFDRLKSSFTKLRGVADIQPVIDDARTINAPREALNDLAQKAASSCTSICRRAILANMAAKGISSKNIRGAIGRGYAIFWAKRGIVRFRMAAGEEGWEHTIKTPGGPKTYVDKRKNGPYVMQASLDAGRVIGLGVGAERAKRSIKAGTAGAKTYKESKQRHKIRIGTFALTAKTNKLKRKKSQNVVSRDSVWVDISRAEIERSKITVVPGRNFWEFTPAQEAEIVAHFRKTFFGLVQKHGYGQRT